MWFPRLPSDRALRIRPTDRPFALSLRQGSADSLYCLNAPAEAAGLRPGQPLSEARAFCPRLLAEPADPAADARMLETLRRWSLRYCPWAATDGRDGLLLDVTGSAHLHGGEASLVADARARLTRAGFGVRIGVADTRGAAWALAHFAGGIAPPGAAAAALAPLPVAALRIDGDREAALRRLGLRGIGDLAARARGPLARRFGRDLLDRLDQALGILPEAIAPLADPPRYAARLTLPEPIGLVGDVMAGLDRLLARLCDKLRADEAGARTFVLTLRRVDRAAQDVPLRLAAPMRDPGRILPLFARGVAAAEAGFGIDQLRLEALAVEPMPAAQIGARAASADRLDALITRIGARIGLDNIRRFRPVESHIPERSFALVPAAEAPACGPWPARPDRPLTLFPPEPIDARAAAPPGQFRWRGMRLATGRATGPERIAPEWWRDEGWTGGVRDYWRIETRQGRRLWMFHTPQDPGWFVQGEFL